LRQYLGEDAASTLVPTKTTSTESAAFSLDMPLDYLGCARTLRIGFPKLFPRHQLTLKVEPSPWLEWPHAMRDGLCLHGFRERPVTGSPEDIVNDNFKRLAKILALSVAGSDPSVRAREFAGEILSYWSLQLVTSIRRVTLLDRPNVSTPLYALDDPRSGSNSRLASLWLAQDLQTLKAQYRRSSGRNVLMRALAQPAFFLKLTSLPPLQVPQPQEFLGWIQEHAESEDSSALADWFEKTGRNSVRWIAVELPGEQSGTIYCFHLRSSALARGRGPRFNLRSGRRGRTWLPSASPSHLQHAGLDILDRSTVLSRDRSGDANLLYLKRIVVVGQGSLGSTVALQLARAGVGHITIIDNDVFKSENIGRHVLGVEDLGQSKAVAMKEMILRSIPHVDVRAIDNFVEVAIVGDESVFSKADLVIVTTADWASEVALWRLKSAGATWTLIQAWSEPHSFVGHALISSSDDSDGRELFDPQGNFFGWQSSWPDAGIIALPACGDAFIPGSGGAITAIAGMVAEAAVRSLDTTDLDRSWLTLVSKPREIASLGGSYRGPSLPDDLLSCVYRRKWSDVERNE